MCLKDLIVMKRKFVLVLVIALLVPLALSARNVFDARFGFNALYVPPESGISFDETMAANTSLGGNVLLRLWNVQATMMAVAVAPQGDGDPTSLSGFNLYTDISLSVPVVPDYIFLTLGAGIATDFRTNPDTNAMEAYFPSYGAETATTVPLTELALGQAVTNSSLFWKFGLDLFLGPFNANVFYMMRTPATLSALSAGQWDKLVQSSDNAIGVGFSLALF